MPASSLPLLITSDGALPVVRPCARRRHDVRAAPVWLLLLPGAVGVKVERPTGRTTLTPARTGATSQPRGSRAHGNSAHRRHLRCALTGQLPARGAPSLT